MGHNGQVVLLRYLTGLDRESLMEDTFSRRPCNFFRDAGTALLQFCLLSARFSALRVWCAAVKRTEFAHQHVHDSQSGGAQCLHAPRRQPH